MVSLEDVQVSVELMNLFSGSGMMLRRLVNTESDEASEILNSRARYRLYSQVARNPAGECVGFIYGNPLEESDPTCVCVRGFAVSHQDIAPGAFDVTSALMKWFEESATNQRKKTVCVLVNGTDKIANEFFVSRNYKKLFEEKDGDNDTLVTYQLELPEGDPLTPHQRKVVNEIVSVFKETRARTVATLEEGDVLVRHEIAVPVGDYTVTITETNDEFAGN